MQSVRATSQRVFVEHVGLPCLLRGVTLETWERGWLTLIRYLPGELDLTFPCTLYLVFQESDDPQAFFDEQQPGRMIAFDHFRVIESMPSTILSKSWPADVTAPPSEFDCTYETMRQWPMAALA